MTKLALQTNRIGVVSSKHVTPFVARSRAVRLVVRASKAEELNEMETYKAKLAQSLDAASKPPATAAPASTNGKDLPILDADNFWDTVKAESVSRPVFIDVFTQWCGPCKVIYPILVQMQEDLGENKIKMFKFEASKGNATVGKALGIKTVPTFIMFKNGEEIGRSSGSDIKKVEKFIHDNLA